MILYKKSNQVFKAQAGTKTNVPYRAGDRVTYGTPEYKEAYDKGEVVSPNGTLYTPSNKVNRGGKNFDKTYLPTMTKLKDAPCVGGGCGKQVTNDTSKLTGVYDTSATFDPKIFGTNDHSGYGQWNVPTTYANKRGKDGKLLTRQINLTSEQLMNPKTQRDSISQGDKIYLKRPGYMNIHNDKSNKLYGKGKTDQEIRHVALAVGKNDKGEVLYQHSMGRNGLQRETMAGLQERGYVPKSAYRTAATHQRLQENDMGYQRKTKLNTDSNSDYVNKTKAIIYQTKEEIGTRNGLTRSLMDKLSSNVIPIGIQESNVGFKKVNKGRALIRANRLSNYIDDMYDSRAVNGIVKPVAKTISNIESNIGSFFNKIKDGDFEKAFTQGNKKSAWELELKANELAKNNPAKYREIYRKLKYDNDNQYVDIAPGKSSKGFGKIKDIPKVAIDLGVTDYNLQGSNSDKRDTKIRNSAIASQAVLAENAARIKSKYPNLSEDSIVEMAITSYNSGLGTILNDKYVENYVTNKKIGVDGKPLESNYLRKILNLKNPAFNFKAK